MVAGRQIDLGYVAGRGEVSERRVHPLGLAARRHAWYLIAETDAGQRTFRVDRVTSVGVTDEAVVRPPDFDLEEAWRSISEEVSRRWPTIEARGHVVPEHLELLGRVLGTRLQIGPTRSDGAVEILVRGENLMALAGDLAGFGAWVEITSPVEVRHRLAKIGAELVATYGSTMSET